MNLKTKLDPKNPQHQVLIGTLAMFVDDFGYTTKELYALMNDSQKQLWHALIEIENENAVKH